MLAYANPQGNQGQRRIPTAAVYLKKDYNLSDGNKAEAFIWYRKSAAHEWFLQGIFQRSADKIEKELLDSK